jgi:hypothetical protein
MKKRRACRVVGIAPATFYYGARRSERTELREKLRAFPEGWTQVATRAFPPN